MPRYLALASLLLGISSAAHAQDSVFTHADTLRGSITPERAWWDVTFYDLHVSVNPADSTIRGWNGITYKVTGPSAALQIDLQVPMEVDSIVQEGQVLGATRDGNAFMVTLKAAQPPGSSHTVTVYYHGRPRVAHRAPWDGGYVWATDSLGRPWVVTANQGLGASVWWPNKDTQADEPDSQRVAITVPDPMMDVSNGRLRSTVHNPDKTTTYEWFVASPINNYDVAVNAGQYAHWTDSYKGEAGKLSMDFWPLDYHKAAAEREFVQAKTMLQCFEHWFGPYPWYTDGYKLVETPHLGMEHQSAIAYGNHYQNGYLGRDLSRTGWGTRWDFIIVHESAHEWWGNSITSKDIADSWVHEGFANYAENLYAACRDGARAGDEYVMGTRPLVQNRSPVVGRYGVQNDGSGDMYYKGGNMLHTIRQIINDDAKWRRILRGLNKEFWHQTVTGQQVQDYISREAGVDLSTVFTQYLTTTKIPVFEYKVNADSISYRWGNVVPGFAMPVRARLTDKGWTLLHPTETWQTAPLTVNSATGFGLDRNFYVDLVNVALTPPSR